MKKTTRKNSTKYSYRPTEVPVTQGMLYGVRDELKAEMRSVEGKISSQVHGLTILVEEQNAKNNVVLDGLTNIFHRQERLENANLIH